MKKEKYLLLILITCLLSQADTLYVGSSYKYKTPNNVAKIAKDGDVILIAPGTYQNQACNWNQNNLTLKGIDKYARLIAPSVIPNQKAIWVLKGNNVTLENIEFTKAKVPDKNGAGIRAEGYHLTIKRCYFHNNEEGILGGKGNIKIENSIFENNGFGDGYSHNLYIGHCDTLIFQFCYSHHTKMGHNLKSRAKVNFILYNRIMDEKNGTSSFCIDIPNGGFSIIAGNLLQQGKHSENLVLLSLGAEEIKNPGHTYIVNNTIVNERSRGIFVKNFGTQSATLINNLFIGDGIISIGKSRKQSNIKGTESDIIDIVNFNYNLSKNSKAINAGTEQLQTEYNDIKISLAPKFEYLHPASSRKRIVKETIDVGALEYAIFPVKKKLNKSTIHHLNKLDIQNDPTLKIYNMKGMFINQCPLTDFKLSVGEYLYKIHDKKGNNYTYKLNLLLTSKN